MVENFSEERSSHGTRNGIMGEGTPTPRDPEDQQRKKAEEGEAVSSEEAPSEEASSEEAPSGEVPASEADAEPEPSGPAEEENKESGDDRGLTTEPSPTD